jgi:hypothetical protein
MSVAVMVSVGSHITVVIWEHTEVEMATVSMIAKKTS